MSIETKKIKDQECINCKGTGVKHIESFINGIYNQRFEQCAVCHGTGRFVEHYSYFIDDKKKIAFGGEVGQ